MWYPATVTAAAATEPVTLAQAKAQCQIAGADDSRDLVLNQAIATARAKVEKYCSIRLVAQTVAVECDCFSDFRRFTQAPLQSVTSIAYVDAAGADQVLDVASYTVRKDDLAPSVQLKFGRRWPEIQPGSRIRVTAIVGYVEVPADIVGAILLEVGKLSAFSRDDLLKRSEEVEGIGTDIYSGAVEVTGAIDTMTANLLESYRNWGAL